MNNNTCFVQSVGKGAQQWQTTNKGTHRSELVDLKANRQLRKHHVIKHNLERNI